MKSHMKPLIPLTIAAALLLSGCYTVTGDSRSSQIAAAGQPVGVTGYVQPGCGYTGQGLIPGCEIPKGTPPAGDRVMLVVSIWDVGAPDLTGYTEHLNHYQALGHDVIAVEAPEQDTIDATTGTLLWSAADAATLNARVADHLGCTIVDDIGTTREPFGEDGIHYSQTSANRVMANLSTLTAADAC